MTNFSILGSYHYHNCSIVSLREDYKKDLYRPFIIAKSDFLANYHKNLEIISQKCKIPIPTDFTANDTRMTVTDSTW